MLLLSACGFTPVYGTHSTGKNLSSIDVAIIPDRNGQTVRNHLLDRLYRDREPIEKKYILTVSPIEESNVNVIFNKNDDASRAQLRLSASFTLTDNEDGSIVLQRVARATTGYNILAGQFTTFITQQDAREQALRAISNNIITQIEVYFNQ